MKNIIKILQKWYNLYIMYNTKTNIRYFADFETLANRDDYTRVYLWGLMSENSKKYYRGVDIETFFKKIVEKKIKIVYFHNLSFDGEFMIHYFLSNGYSFTEEKKLSPFEFSWLCDGMKSYYKITVKFKYHICIFKCSYKLLKSSVKNLGEALGHEGKLEMDYSLEHNYKAVSEVPIDILKYLHNDIDIVRQSFLKFTDNYNPKTTIASTSIHNFINHYSLKQYRQDFGWYNRKTQEFVGPIDRNEWDLIKLAYKGGLVGGKESTRGNLIECKGIELDINSLYPYIMKDYKLPYGKMLYERPNGDYCVFYDIFIISATQKDNDMISHLHKEIKMSGERKYYKEAFNIRCIYMKEEWEELLKTYDIRYMINDKYYFKTKIVFKSWIEKLSKLKINAKTKIERLYHKTIQNSCYGKFGQRYKITKRVIAMDKEGKINGTRYGRNSEYVSMLEYDETTNTSYIPMAAAITAYCRVKLLKAIRSNKDIFIYSDTDSMKLSSTNYKDVKIDDKEYGAWKIEGYFDKFKWLKAKCYMSNNKPVIAGLPAESRHLITMSNFDYNVEVEGEGNLRKKAVKGGYIFKQSIFKIKEFKGI